MHLKFYISTILLLLTLYACQKEGDEQKDLLFKVKNDSGIDYRNDLSYTQELNPYTYRNYYNGAGIGVGDFDNDGLEDVYLSGNQVDNALYRNLGDLKFEKVDIPLLSSTGSWSTGVSIVDINADGLMDIYVCKAGPPEGPNRANELFINLGDWQFEERAADYGLDIKGFSIQASFFDFDKDGDLDCYLLNNSLRSVGGYDLRPNLRNISTKEGNKLLVNEGGKYVNRSEELGIHTSEIGFGLGVITADISGDTWPDIYVSNDFFERDYYYINQEGKGFKEVGDEYFSSYSLGSMGADAGDIDQDGDLDVFVAEMAPATMTRQKTKAMYDSWDKYQRALKSGYASQYSRNMLHINEDGHFQDISRASGIEATEWSWAPLIFDFDNDGHNDLFVSNGVGKDLLDRDYLAYMANEQSVAALIAGKDDESLKKLIDIMPESKVDNAFFIQRRKYEFEDIVSTHTDLKPSVSNASAFADFDLDGDLDLIISNINDPASVLENRSYGKNFVLLDLIGNAGNPSAIGAKVELIVNGAARVAQQNPYRGFQSTVSSRIHFGLDSITAVEDLVVTWTDGQIERYTDLTINEINKIKKGEGEPFVVKPMSESDLIIQVIDSIEYDYPVRLFNEFNKEKLLVKMSDKTGPMMYLNNSRKEIISGGAKGHHLNISKAENIASTSAIAETIINPHVTDIVEFDFDGDGDMDLYIAHGGRVFSKYSTELNDQILIKKGNDYSLIPDAVTFDSPTVTGAVAAGDLDGDGYEDIVIGEQVAEDIYGAETSLYVYMNEKGKRLQGKISITDLGAIHDVAIADLDNDGILEIIVAGEWMSIKIFHVKGDDYQDVTENFGMSQMEGMWRSIQIVDIDQDGDLDMIATNQGTNSIFSKEHKLYVNDFDQNGRKEQILTRSVAGIDYPELDFDDMAAQMPSIKRKYQSYAAYAEASIDEIFDIERISEARVLSLSELRSALFINYDGVLRFQALPAELQYSSMYASAVADVNNDGILDILIGGNEYRYKPQFGRDDASRGHVLLGSMENDEYTISSTKSLGIKGEIRSIIPVGDDEYLIGVYGEDIKKYKIEVNE